MQLAFSTAVAAAAFVLSALSFQVVYTSGRFFHLAHASAILLGPYLCLGLVKLLTCSPVTAAVPGALLTGVTGASLFLAVFRPFLRRGSSPLVLLLASLAVQLMIQHTVALVAGEDAHSLLGPDAVQVFTFAGARVTSVQLVLIALAAGTTALLGPLLARTRLGLYHQAVAEHAELSTIYGVPVLRVQTLAFGLASSLAGALGILVGMDLAFSPTMGLHWLLPGVVAVIVGGIRRVEGVAAAACGLAVLRTAVIWYLGSAWENVVLYTVLFLYLLIWPESALRPGRRV